MIRKTRLSASTAERRRASAWLIAALAAVALLAAVFYKQNPLGQGAAGYARSVAVASAGVYVTLRSLNAMLSTAQEVEVGTSIVVTGSVQPLKVLEPIDDTIERIAGLVFAMMVVTGVIAVAMGPMTAVGAVLIAVASGVWMLDNRARLGLFPLRLGIYGAFLALALPLAFLVASWVADRLTNEVWAEHTAIVASITEDVGLPVGEGAEGQIVSDDSFIEELNRYRQLAFNIYERADELLGSLIAILSVFVFKIFVLPALIVGALYLVLRRLAQG